MKRRDFVSRVALGAAAACTLSKTTHAATVSGQMRMRFVGMMTFIERADHSFLVATPGEQAVRHMAFLSHRPVRLLAAAALVFAATLPGSAQSRAAVTVDDYARAEKFMG